MGRIGIEFVLKSDKQTSGELLFEIYLIISLELSKICPNISPSRDDGIKGDSALKKYFEALRVTDIYITIQLRC